MKWRKLLREKWDEWFRKHKILFCNWPSFQHLFQMALKVEKIGWNKRPGFIFADTIWFSILFNESFVENELLTRTFWNINIILTTFLISSSSQGEVFPKEVGTDLKWRLSFGLLCDLKELPNCFCTQLSAENLFYVLP